MNSEIHQYLVCIYVQCNGNFHGKHSFNAITGVTEFDETR